MRVDASTASAFLSRPAARELLLPWLQGAEPQSGPRVVDLHLADWAEAMLSEDRPERVAVDIGLVALGKAIRWARRGPFPVYPGRTPVISTKTEVTEPTSIGRVFGCAPKLTPKPRRNPCSEPARTAAGGVRSKVLKMPKVLKVLTQPPISILPGWYENIPRRERTGRDDGTTEQERIRVQHSKHRYSESDRPRSAA